jgi:hypothetical protein
MPRDLHSMRVPRVGEYVEVYFMLGDENRPVYRGQFHEIAGGTPPAYDGPQKVVLYQDPDEELTLMWDRESGEVTLLTVDGNEVIIGSDGITINDTNGNTIEMGSSSVLVNGNLEVLQ